MIGAGKSVTIGNRPRGYKIFVDSHHNQYTMWIIFSSVYVTIQVSSCACAGLKSTSHDCLLIGLQCTLPSHTSPLPPLPYLLQSSSSLPLLWPASANTLPPPFFANIKISFFLSPFSSHLDIMQENSCCDTATTTPSHAFAHTL